MRSHCTWLPSPTGNPVAIDLDDAAEGVAGFFARVDFGDDCAFGVGIGDPHLRRFGNAAQLGDAQISGCVFASVAPMLAT